MCWTRKLLKFGIVQSDFKENMLESSGFVQSVLRKNALKDIQLAYVQFDFRKNTLLRCEIWRFTISIEE